MKKQQNWIHFCPPKNIFFTHENRGYPLVNLGGKNGPRLNQNFVHFFPFPYIARLGVGGHTTVQRVKNWTTFYIKFPFINRDSWGPEFCQFLGHFGPHFYPYIGPI